MTKKKTPERQSLGSRDEITAPGTFIIRDPDPEIWAAAMRRAAKEGRTMKFVILALLKRYAKEGLE